MTQKKKILVLELNKHSKTAEMLLAFLFQAQLNNWSPEEVMAVLKEVQEAMDTSASEVLKKYLTAGSN